MRIAYDILLAVQIVILRYFLIFDEVWNDWHVYFENVKYIN